MEGALLQKTKSTGLNKPSLKNKVRSTNKLSKAQTLAKYEPKRLSWFCLRTRGRDVKTAKKSGKGKKILGSAQAMLATEWISAKQKGGKNKKSLCSNLCIPYISNFESQSYSHSDELEHREETYDEEKDFFIEPPNFNDQPVIESQKAFSAKTFKEADLTSPGIPRAGIRYARSMSSGLNMMILSESRSSEEHSNSIKMALMQRIKKDTQNLEIGPQSHSDGMTQEAKADSVLSLDKCIYKAIDFSEDCASIENQDQKVNPQSDDSSNTDSSQSQSSSSHSGSTSSSGTTSQSSSGSNTTSRSERNSQSNKGENLVLLSERSTQERCNSCRMLDQHLDSMICKLPKSKMCDIFKQLLTKMQQMLQNNLSSQMVCENSCTSGVSVNFATALQEFFSFELQNMFDAFVSGIVQNEKQICSDQSQTEEFDHVTENAVSPPRLEFLPALDQYSQGLLTQRFSSQIAARRLSEPEHDFEAITQNVPLNGGIEFQEDELDMPTSFEVYPTSMNLRHSQESHNTMEVGQGLNGLMPPPMWPYRLCKYQSANDGDLFTTATMSNQGPFNLSPQKVAYNQQRRDSSIDMKLSPTPKFSSSMPFQMVPRQSRSRAYTSPQINLGGGSIETRSDLSSDEILEGPKSPDNIFMKTELNTPFTMCEQEQMEMTRAKTTYMRPKVDMCSPIFQMAPVEDPDFLLPPPANKPYQASQLSASSPPFFPGKFPSFSNFDVPENSNVNFSPQLNQISRILQSLDLKRCRPMPQEPCLTVPEPPVQKPDDGLQIVRVERKALTRKTRKEGGIIFYNQDKMQNYQYQKYLEQNRYERLFLEKDKIGQGGFGQVFKVQHCLDQRTYAIKKIRIHLGLHQDFKMHSVYREILAISQVQHENVVRYHACWIEAVQPNNKVIDKVVKKIEVQARQKYKDLKQEQKELFSQSDNDSLLDVEKLRDREWSKDEQNYKFTGKPFRLSVENMDIIGDKYQGKNLLKVIEDDQDPIIDEEWSYQIEQSGIQRQKKRRLQFDDTSSASSSEESSEQIQESSCESEDEPNSVGSLYQLVDQGQDFITLEVMIQMEYCLGDTLRAFLDETNYKPNRKVIFHLFKQLILGLRHIHEEGLIHRDIKPANIFIDKSRLQLKIGDFGLAKQSKLLDFKRSESLNNFNIFQAQQQNEQPQKRKTVLKQSLAAVKHMSCQALNEKRNAEQERIQDASFCAGTPMYQAPEQLKRQKEPLTDKVDMFAAGLILMELCCGFKSQHQRILAFHSLKTLRTLDLPGFEHMQEEKQVILRLTEANPKKRLSASHLLDSEVFQSWQFESKQ